MESLLSLGVGIGLSAACGFRVFVPLLVLGLAARSGLLAVSPGFEWLSTGPALMALGTATVLEVLAYFIPWLDHLLDALATPTAVIAGILASAAVLTDLPPVFRWGLAVIAGGGTAGLVQGASVLLRLKSAALTGGLANPAVALVELAGSLVTALLAIALPVLAVALVLAFCILAFRVAGRILFGRRRGAGEHASTP
jgi:hypothetical protein